MCPLFSGGQASLLFPCIHSTITNGLEQSETVVYMLKSLLIHHLWVGPPVKSVCQRRSLPMLTLLTRRTHKQQSRIWKLSIHRLFLHSQSLQMKASPSHRGDRLCPSGLR